MRLLCIVLYLTMSLSNILLFYHVRTLKSEDGMLFRHTLVSTIIVNLLYIGTILSSRLIIAKWVYAVYFASIDVMLFFLMNTFYSLIRGTNDNVFFSAIKKVLTIAVIIDIILQLSNPITGIEVSFYKVSSPLLFWDFHSHPLYKVHLSICYLIILVSFAALFYRSSTLPKLYRAYYERMMVGILLVVLLNAVYLLLKDIVVIDISVAFYSFLGYFVYWMSFRARDKYLIGRLQNSVFEDILQPVFLFGWDKKLVFCNKNAKYLFGNELKEQITLDEFAKKLEFGDSFKDFNHDSRVYWANEKINEFSYICDFRVIRDKKSSDILGRFFIFTDSTLGIDPLTGYHTEAYLMHHINELINSTKIGIAVSDLNRLTILNNTVGREGGDRALLRHSELLREAMPKDTIFVRLQDANLCCISNHLKAEELKEILSETNEKMLSDLSFPFRLSFNFAVADIENASEINQVILRLITILKTRKLLDSDSDHSSVIDSLHQMLLECDAETEMHVRRTRELGEKLSYILGLSDYERDQLSLLCLFHDIGKVGVPKEIITKPSRLTESERNIMRTHAEKGYRIAKATPELNIIAPAILHHHENWDGSGYPDGLKYEDIPLLSRVIAVVDSFDAMVSDRPYRKALSEERAFQELKNYAGKQFDPYIVDCFLAMMSGKKIPYRTIEDDTEVLSENEQVTMVTAVKYACYDIGLDFTIYNVDKNFEHLTGYSSYDVGKLKLTQNDLIFDEDKEVYWEIVNKQLAKDGIAYLEHRIKRIDGTGRYIYCTGISKGDHYTCIVSDITDSVSVQLQVGLARNRVMMSLHRLEESNQKDPLTGALNRSAFRRHAEQLLSDSNSRYLFLMVDIDNFKLLNDTYGHPKGDEILIQLANVLSNGISLGSLTGRMGGDEFCCLIKLGLDSSITEINEELEKLRNNIKEALFFNNHYTTVSMGGIVVHNGDVELENLYNEADKELYKAKREGKDRFSIKE